MKDFLIALVQQNKFWSWLMVLTITITVAILIHLRIISFETFIDLYKFTVNKFQNFKLV